MVDAKHVILKPINYRINVEQDPEFVEYIKKKLIGTTLRQGNKIEVSTLDAFLPLFVEQTKPQGEVTMTENTELRILNEFMRMDGSKQQGLNTE